MKENAIKIQKTGLHGNLSHKKCTNQNIKSLTYYESVTRVPLGSFEIYGTQNP